MAGLIDKQMPEQEPPENTPADLKEDQAEGAPEGSPANAREDSAEGRGQELTPEAVDAAIKMPPELQEAYQRVVIAGMKVMFDPSTHALAMKQLQGDGPISQRLGRAVAGLLATLFKESNNTMPPQVLVPAGTSLLVRAGDFLKKSGEQITDADIGEALAVMIETVLTGFGLDPQKVLAAGYQAPQGGLVDQAGAQPVQE